MFRSAESSALVERVVRSAEPSFVGANPFQAGRGESVAARHSRRAVIKGNPEIARFAGVVPANWLSISLRVPAQWPLAQRQAGMARQALSASGAGFGVEAPRRRWCAVGFQQQPRRWRWPW